MDLFAIIGTIWRHRIAAIPVVLITLMGAFYVLEVKAPTYQSTGEVLLANPPSPPTSAQIAADPALAKVNASNPYLSYGNLVLVADVLIDVVNSAATQESLVKEGASPTYTVALAPLLDNPPAIRVTGTATSAAAAIRNAQLVTQSVAKDLYQIQANENVAPDYMITSIELVKPMTAFTSSSGKLRNLVGLLALGLILLLVAISFAQALENRKRERTGRPVQPERASGEVFPGPGEYMNYEYVNEEPGRHSASRIAAQQPPDSVAGNRPRYEP
jgi:capsular polysaccharide biosynthesis protein